MFNFIKANTQKFSDTVNQKLSEVQIQKYMDTIQKFVEEDMYQDPKNPNKEFQVIEHHSDDDEDFEDADY